ncbi:MAG: tRNA preQ1(34) S-adenosylmethionine ribosyltransferase-isomerase QueA [Candidatus Margulisiibacteriota bacterium]
MEKVANFDPATANLRAADFDYFLPEKLIAQTPAQRRDTSRLLCLDRRSGKFSHHRFFEIEKFLRPGDLLILNDTKVIPARLIGIKEGGSAKIDVLLLSETEKNIWKCLVRPGKRLKVGARVIFAKGKLAATVLSKHEDGSQFLQFTSAPTVAGLGKIPLPPYIKSALPVSAKSYLGRRYQTVFANIPGAAAAPTAGLHFTRGLLARLKKKGVNIAYLTLHTGLGTFRPVYAEYIHDHKMHSEYFEIGRACIEAIKKCKSEQANNLGRGGRIVAVGTTVVRALETLALRETGGGEILRNKIKPGFGETDLFLTPGFKFKLVDALITNFHFPRSSLLMLAAAFVQAGMPPAQSELKGTHGFKISGESLLAGRDLLLRAYAEAKRKKYRFFSFGDAMLIM